MGQEPLRLPACLPGNGDETSNEHTDTNAGRQAGVHPSATQSSPSGP